MINAVLHSKVEEAIRNLDIDEMIDIPTHEISSALNYAQLRLFEEYYQNFEKNETARKCLNNFVKPYTTTTLFINNYYKNNLYNAYDINLPQDCARVLEEHCILSIDEYGRYTSNESLMIETIVKPIRLDTFRFNLHNPWKKPYNNLLWRVDVGDGNSVHVLICKNNININRYTMSYLRLPSEINIENDPNGSNLFGEDFQLILVTYCVDRLLEVYQNNINLKKLSGNIQTQTDK